MPNGWVKLHRSLVDWEWHDQPETMALFVHLLMLANHKATSWRGVRVLPGQILTGRKKLAEVTGLSERQIRTCLKRLKSTNEVTIKSTSKFSIITLNKWEVYQQEATSTSTNKRSNERPASDQQATTSKNVKKDKNVKKEKSNSISLNRKQTEKLRQAFPGTDVRLELRKANDYLKAEGIRKNDYMAWFRNWLRRGSKEQTAVTIRRNKQRDAALNEPSLTAIQKQRNLKRIADLKNKHFRRDV